MADFSESYSNKLLKGIVKYSQEHSPWVVCKMPMSVYASKGLKEVVKFAVDWHADAIIGQFNEGENVRLFAENGIIAVAQDYRKRFEGIINISGDYLQAGKICADYFIKLGVHNFAFYGLDGAVWSEERRDGFVGEILKHNKNAHISIKERPAQDDSWWYNSFELKSWLSALPKPVGILACDDNLAWHITEACQQGEENGMRIPHDILLLGVDNDESLCQLSCPQISSLNQQVERAGYNTAALIEARLKLPAEERFQHPNNIVVQHTCITVRESTDVFLHENPYIKRICTFILRHLNQRILVDDLVELVPMSRRLLEMTFRKEIGVSIYHYVILARIEKMKTLILNGSSAQEAARELDMDYKAISKTFKKMNGLSPAEYARNINDRRASPE